jgi:hypothetical protein
MQARGDQQEEKTAPNNIASGISNSSANSPRWLDPPAAARPATIQQGAAAKLASEPKPRPVHYGYSESLSSQVCF